MPKSDSSFNPEQYATVAERIDLFYARFPAGRITTELFARDEGEIIFKAFVYRDSTDAPVAATGWAAEREGDGDINTVACLENTETSAVGRALANLGFTASTRRPSREEMEKVARVRGSLPFRKQNNDDNVSPQLQAHATDDVLDALGVAGIRGSMRRMVVGSLHQAGNLSVFGVGAALTGDRPTFGSFVSGLVPGRRTQQAFNSASRNCL